MAIHQRIDLVRDFDQPGAVFLGVDVERRTDVQAAHVDMAVDAKAQPVPGEDLEKAVKEGRQLLGGHHAILDEGHRPRPPLDLAEQPDACRADRP